MFLRIFCLLKTLYLKTRPPGEVAALADGEGYCRDFRPLIVRYLLFSGEEKRSKKVAGTLAAVSRAKAPGRNYKLLPALATNSPPDCLRSASRPQRSLVCEKTNTCSFTVGTGVPDCPIVVLSKSTKINLDTIKP